MRLTNAAERAQLDAARELLLELGYPTAAKAINDALIYDSEQREAQYTLESNP